MSFGAVDERRRARIVFSSTAPLANARRAFVDRQRRGHERLRANEPGHERRIGRARQRRGAPGRSRPRRWRRRRPAVIRCGRRPACRASLRPSIVAASTVRSMVAKLQAVRRAIVVHDLDVVGALGDSRIDKSRRIGWPLPASESACRTACRVPSGAVTSVPAEKRSDRRSAAVRLSAVRRAWPRRTDATVNMSSSVVTPNIRARRAHRRTRACARR